MSLKEKTYRGNKPQVVGTNLRRWELVDTTVPLYYETRYDDDDVVSPLSLLLDLTSVGVSAAGDAQRTDMTLVTLSQLV